MLSQVTTDNSCPAVKVTEAVMRDESVRLDHAAS